MSDKDKKPSEVQFPRRRLGRIVHDERGRASMEWEPLDADERRPEHRQALELIDDTDPENKPLLGGARNPYQGAGQSGKAPTAEPGARRPKDLRKLSAWILQQREVAKRKKEDGER